MLNIVVEIGTGLVLQLLESIILIVFLDIFFQRRYKTGVFVFIAPVAMIIVFTTVSSITDLAPVLMIVSLIIMLTVSILGYRGNVLSKILASFIYWILLNAMDYLIALGALSVFVPNAVDWLEISQNKLMVSIITKMLVFVIVLLIRQVWTSKKSDLVIPADEFVYLVLFPVMSLVSIMVMTNIYDTSSNISSLIVVYAVVLFALNIFMFWFISASAKRKKTQLDNEKLEQQLFFKMQETVDLTNSHMVLRRQAHEHKNALQTIYSLVDDGKNDEAKEYIRTMTTELSCNMHVINSGNTYLDAVLNSKYTMMVENGITASFDIDNCSGLELLSPDDIVTIFGNTIDNAIEASMRNTSRGDIRIQIQCKDSQYIYTIVNQVDGPSISFTKSSKEKDPKSHGHGLHNVKKAIEKYNGRFDIRYKDGHVTFIMVIRI